MESELIISELITQIKSKKELSTLNDEFIKEILLKQLKELKIDFSKYNSFKQFSRSSICKNIISKTRSQLRIIYGVFIKEPSSNLKKILNEISTYDDEKINLILASHQSSYERLNYYQEIYKKIFSILFDLKLKKDFSILDLACGFNPIAYKYLPIKPTYYLASDLSNQDMNFIKDFFIKTKISGDAISLDLTNLKSIEKLNSLQNFDVCFLFKALDSLESSSRHISKKLISNLNCKFFVVSFPTKTLGGKKQILESKRSWFEKFCEKNNYILHTTDLNNELFYIFSKQ